MNSDSPSRPTTVACCLSAALLLVVGCADASETALQDPSTSARPVSEPVSSETLPCMAFHIFEVEAIPEYLFPTPGDAVRAILGDAERGVGVLASASPTEESTGPSIAAATRLEDQARLEALEALMEQVEEYEAEDAGESREAIEFSASTAAGETRTTVVFVDTPEASGWAMQDLDVPLEDDVCGELEDVRASEQAAG